MGILIKTSIFINEPVEKVWEIFMDPGNLQHWLTGFVSVTPLTGEPGKAGSTSNMKFIERGKEMNFIETVRQVNQMQQYSFRMEHTTFATENDIRFISFVNRTELVQTVELFPKVFFMKLVTRFMKGAMKKQMGKELLKLKIFIETKQNQQTA